MKHYDVVAAIIIHNDRILCVQRGASKYTYVSNKYEFPGGKIEAGESEADALVREISEELAMDIVVLKKFLTVEHSYPDFSLTMHSFLCEVKTRELTLTEHIDAQWLLSNELEPLDWAAADIPIVERLINFES